MRFEDREHAARLLVERLSAEYRGKNPLVLAVPRGAAPMAKIIADGLGGELDVVLVHKLGHPEQPELAIGAVDESGNTFISDWAADLPSEYIEAEKLRQVDQLRRRRERYTPSRPPRDPGGRIVIVVDDGVATGSTMIAALRAVRSTNPQKLAAAVAVASREAARTIARECDDLVCLAVPAEFYAVGQFFDDFAQITDEDVIKILKESETKGPRAADGR